MYHRSPIELYLNPKRNSRQDRNSRQAKTRVKPGTCVKPKTRGYHNNGRTSKGERENERNLRQD